MIQPPSTADGEAIYNDWLLGQVYALPKVYKDTRATVQQLHDHFKATGVAHGDWIRIKSGLHALLRERRIVPAWPFAQTYTAVGERRYVKWFGRYVLKAEFDEAVLDGFRNITVKAPNTDSRVREELGGARALSRAQVRAALRRLAERGLIEHIEKQSYDVARRYWVYGEAVTRFDFGRVVLDQFGILPSPVSPHALLTSLRRRMPTRRFSGEPAFREAFDRLESMGRIKRLEGLTRSDLYELASPRADGS